MNHIAQKNCAVLGDSWGTAGTSGPMGFGGTTWGESCPAEGLHAPVWPVVAGKRNLEPKLGKLDERAGLALPTHTHSSHGLPTALFMSRLSIREGR